MNLQKLLTKYQDKNISYDFTIPLTERLLAELLLSYPITGKPGFRKFGQYYITTIHDQLLVRWLMESIKVHERRFHTSA